MVSEVFILYMDFLALPLSLSLVVVEKLFIVWYRGTAMRGEINTR